MHPLELVIVGWLALVISTLVDAIDYLDDYSAMDYTDESDIDYNATNCTNSYCISNEEYVDRMINYIFPKFWDWVLIASHSVVFVVGLVGNALVCIAVYRNHSMRTVTNYFIVNLAVADFLVLLLCLPFTVLWDITETWFLGLTLCKAVPYLQTVSVTVSILTLTFISIDRWYAICFPLRFKSTTGRAKSAIIGIWAIALLFDIPDLVVLHTVPPTHIKIKTVLFTQCDISWSQRSQVAFTIVKLIFLYTGPLIFMSVAYWQIVKVLWRSNIPGHNLPSRASQMSQIPSTGGGNPEVQLRSRRKAAKMLVTVVITFAICYFPVHLLSVLRYTTTLPSNKWINAISLIAHGLCYFNSAVNPLIYNFMSGKFRKAFRRTFRCARENGSRIQRGYLASTSNFPRIKSRTTTIRTTFKNNNNLQRNTEIIPLSAITTIQQNEKHD
ncbi:orexin receptor type 2-like isoform X1 [Bombus pyrosoma]|uniref:orexin receptor type 2-like isoform X1 n=1 Tax=Bombus pyrosoma TaxID=396416 RepID=UPI001CB8BA83|nr:orexin receptor type 2-like isoform X1 [Bombus pyrosoma]XP_043581176.1 orexin receptor type 2-like isoform X1 [Bombus pyrosoma]XP_043581178.1 orexin receptor type 2-like isoform X1 [Bombus pyrosoma]XP_043581179.1 orexin receptor type 2-like isoform X1 [Bombus pyrosoma]XP_043581180.1 orexin receptor type 2-like isoform X1 [Bombus pyrosoma]XP_043581181.1 orexin receptor type 2-like isoform X1 [Bombus pyrosoma]XP_043581182.1 orexin receptor type 2-like isoform X1 [Bombus pyrosoma]XP_04358118